MSERSLQKFTLPETDLRKRYRPESSDDGSTAGKDGRRSMKEAQIRERMRIDSGIPSDNELVAKIAGKLKARESRELFQSTAKSSAFGAGASSSSDKQTEKKDTRAQSSKDEFISDELISQAKKCAYDVQVRIKQEQAALDFPSRDNPPNPLKIPKIREYWNGRLSHWQNVIDTLGNASEIIQYPQSPLSQDCQILLEKAQSEPVQDIINAIMAREKQSSKTIQSSSGESSSQHPFTDHHPRIAPSSASKDYSAQEPKRDIPPEAGPSKPRQETASTSTQTAMELSPEQLKRINRMAKDIYQFQSRMGQAAAYAQPYQEIVRCLHRATGKSGTFEPARMVNQWINGTEPPDDTNQAFHRAKFIMENLPPGAQGGTTSTWLKGFADEMTKWRIAEQQSPSNQEHIVRERTRAILTIYKESIRSAISSITRLKEDNEQKQLLPKLEVLKTFTQEEGFIDDFEVKRAIKGIKDYSGRKSNSITELHSVISTEEEINTFTSSIE